MISSRWQEGRRAWRRLESCTRAEHLDSEAALSALGDLALVRELLGEAQLAVVRAARAGGRPWSEIASALGVSRQAAWERWRELDLAVTPPTAAASTTKETMTWREGGMPTISEVWARIEAHAGEVFHQKRGNPFTYTVSGGCIRPDRTNRLLPRTDFAAALELVPTDSTVSFQHLQGPSYVWAILHDRRIRRSDW